MKRRIYHRAREYGRRAASSLKQPAVAVGAGGVAAIVDAKFLQDQDWIKDHWWAKGALFAVLGYFVRRQWHGMGDPAGYGLLGVGGYALAAGYMDDSKGVEAGAVYGRRPWQNAGAVVNDVFAAPPQMGQQNNAGGYVWDATSNAWVEAG